jgi:hypothetical protein
MGLLRTALAGNWPGRKPALERVTVIDPPEPLEGTRMSLWNSILPSIYGQWDTGGVFGNASLVSRTWVAAVCQDLNASQIAAMRIEWHGPPGVDEPAWVSSPDPAQFPNGIGDALYAINDQIDGWGWSLQYITDTYANGYPRRWTVIPSSSCEPRFDDNGRKVFKLDEQELDPSRVVQIDRNPTTAAHGTSAIYAFAQRAYSLLAAGNKSLSVSQDAFPPGYLKSETRLTSDQAETAALSWMTKTEARAGGVPVLGQGWTFENSGLDPAAMALLDTQKWDATVIANAYGVPAPILNMALEGGLTYQNPEALMRMWWLTRLRTRSKRIMDAFSAQMLPAGQAVTQDASDITVEGSVEASDDPQLAPGGKASPAQQPGGLTAIGGGRA